MISVPASKNHPALRVEQALDALERCLRTDLMNALLSIHLTLVAIGYAGLILI